MANLPETEQWDAGVYQLETSDPVLGGPDGVSNRPQKSLANRTAWLKTKVEAAQGELDAHVRAPDPHPQYAPKASPILTGIPRVPTADQATRTDQAASTAFVHAVVAALVDSSPAALDTLSELAAALGNDANFATTVTNALALKADKSSLADYSRVYSISALPKQNVGPIIVAELGEVWTWAVNAQFTGYRSACCGMVGYFTHQSVQAGWLKADGAAVPIAKCEALAAAIYRGDALNALAPWGYRCTDPAKPNATRSPAGDHIVLPDLRGEFLRGWDDGRGVDAGRQFASSQRASRVIGASSNPSFPYLLSNGEWRYSVDYGSVKFKISDSYTEEYERVDGQQNLLAGWRYENLSFGVTTAAVRPRNVALLACIKI